MSVEFESGRVPLAERFHSLCVALVARLPWGLSSVVAPTVVGFGMLNGCTFALDLLLLTLLHGYLTVPLPAAVTAAYACAFAASFVLNRVLNFRSHGPVYSQAAVYVAVVLVNYLVFILGVSTGLTALGVDYHVARLVAGALEAAYVYIAMRWLVFR